MMLNVYTALELTLSPAQVACFKSVMEVLSNVREDLECDGIESIMNRGTGECIETAELSRVLGVLDGFLGADDGESHTEWECH